MIGPLTYLDAGLLAIALLSGLLAMYRGLTREVLSILSWVVAAGAVLYFVMFQKELAADLAKQMGTKTPIAQVAIGGIVFLIVLVIVHLITSRVSDAILDSSVGMFDRMLGFGFGVIRGFLLVVIPYIFVFGLYLPDYPEKTPWIKNSISRPYIESAGKALRGSIERFMERVDRDKGGREGGNKAPEAN
ncbi:MAG: CvpA family protein [Hyphomicrobiaceae bacterium]|nr:CvpA family protein [Hyphomicrobiaceae bacterium]